MGISLTDLAWCACIVLLLLAIPTCADVYNLERNYFGRFMSLPDAPPPWPVPRVERDLTYAQFMRLAAAGVPLIVGDAMRGLPLRGWTCANFSHHFVDGRMRREYDASNEESAENKQRLGDNAWQQERVPNGVTAAQDAGAPRYAPYYWGIKESAFEPWRGDADLLQEVQRLTELPYFMRASRNDVKVDGRVGVGASVQDATDTLRKMRSSPEFWLGANGTGAKAHVDGHCESTISMQLSGVRRWRLGAPPSGLRRSDSEQLHDGDPYTHYSNNGSQWRPTFVTEIRAGEALLFAPGWIHETTNIGGSCAASVTYQWDRPEAAGHFRQWLPRIQRMGDLSACWDRVAELATLNGNAAHAARADSNGDGALQIGELHALFARQHQRMGKSAVTLARSALLYHDVDGDGQCTLQEVQANVAEFSRVKAEVRAERPIEDSSDDAGSADKDKASDERRGDDDDDAEDDELRHEL